MKGYRQKPETHIHTRLAVRRRERERHTQSVFPPSVYTTLHTYTYIDISRPHRFSFRQLRGAPHRCVAAVEPNCFTQTKSLVNQKKSGRTPAGPLSMLSHLIKSSAPSIHPQSNRRTDHRSTCFGIT